MLLNFTYDFSTFWSFLASINYFNKKEKNIINWVFTLILQTLFNCVPLFLLAVSTADEELKIETSKQAIGSKTHKWPLLYSVATDLLCDFICDTYSSIQTGNWSRLDDFLRRIAWIKAVWNIAPLLNYLTLQSDLSKSMHGQWMVATHLCESVKFTKKKITCLHWKTNVHNKIYLVHSIKSRNKK